MVGDIRKVIEKKLAGLKDPLFKIYREVHADQIIEMGAEFAIQEEILKDQIGIDGLDYFHLAFIVKHKYWENYIDVYDYVTGQYIPRKNGGAEEFLQLLEDFNQNRLSPIRITFAFNELPKKRKEEKFDFDKQKRNNYAQNIVVSGEDFINLIMSKLKFDEFELLRIHMFKKREQNSYQNDNSEKTIPFIRSPKRLWNLFIERRHVKSSQIF